MIAVKVTKGDKEQNDYDNNGEVDIRLRATIWSDEGKNSQKSEDIMMDTNLCIGFRQILFCKIDVTEWVKHRTGFYLVIQFGALGDNLGSYQS